MRVLAWALCVCCWGLGACASAPRSPFFDDEKYLRFGLDPNDEATALLSERKAKGDVLLRKIIGQHFSALSFADSHGKPNAVRVITARGIEIALDRSSGSALEAEHTYELAEPPLADTQDADGDGFEELFVIERVAQRSCVLVYRVLDVGSVDAVPVRAQLFGEDVCPSAVEDVDHDARAELIVELDLTGFGATTPPQLRVPLWAAAHRFAYTADAAAQQRYCAEQRLERERDLAEARHALDAVWAYRLAIELAGLAWLQGETAAAQVGVFDAALKGLVLDATQAEAVAAARTRILEIWSAAPPSSPSAP